MLAHERAEGVFESALDRIHDVQHATPRRALPAHRSTNARAAAHVTQCGVAPSVAPHCSHPGTSGTGSALWSTRRTCLRAARTRSSARRSARRAHRARGDHVPHVAVRTGRAPLAHPAPGQRTVIAAVDLAAAGKRGIEQAEGAVVGSVGVCLALTPWQGPRWSIFGGMKVKTSITLSRELLDAVDAQTGRGRSRSEFIEAALQAFLDKSMRDERGARDLEILNRRATRLNREAVDVLAYQVIP